MKKFTEELNNIPFIKENGLIPSISPSRYPDETFEKYKLRQAYMKKLLKFYLRGYYKHVSVRLIPVIRDGKIQTDETGNIIYSNQRTKGITYIKCEQKT